jgi:hypothetical protein
MPIDPMRALRVQLTIEQIRELCDRWQIRTAPDMTSGMLEVEEMSGPVDVDRLPSGMEARTDVQNLLTTYMRKAHLIVQLLRDQDE